MNIQYMCSPFRFYQDYLYPNSIQYYSVIYLRFGNHVLDQRDERPAGYGSDALAANQAVGP